MEACVCGWLSQCVTLERTTHLSFLVCNLGLPPTKVTAKSGWAGPMDKAGEVLEGHLEQTGGSSPQRGGLAHCCHQVAWVGGSRGISEGARPRACGPPMADREETASALKAGGPQQVAA